MWLEKIDMLHIESYNDIDHTFSVRLPYFSKYQTFKFIDATFIEAS